MGTKKESPQTLEEATGKNLNSKNSEIPRNKTSFSKNKWIKPNKALVLERDSKTRTEDFIKGLENHINTEFSIDGIIDTLPDMLKIPTNYLVDETEKEVFLIGALGVVSGLLSNIKGLYSGKWISSNLFVYVLAGYGSGKGSLEFARVLGKKIHIAKREKAKSLMADYLMHMEIYKKGLKTFNKNKEKGGIPPVKPIQPPASMLFIPANNSKSGVYQLLEENDGKGIIFESEGDTLSDALKQDFGGFSDTLRKAFHHEYLDLFRRHNNEHIEISNPELSVVISSTFDQLKFLIPSAENGLYSRFLFYVVAQNKKFVDVFDSRKKDYQKLFEEAADSFTDLYYQLVQLETPIWFSLTKEQEEKFVQLFDEKKSNLIEEVDITMAGTANRLGIIAFRIMMILTSLRAKEEGNLNNSIICNSIDFDNSLRIVERLEKHAKTVYQYLNGQPAKKELAFQLKEMGTSIRDIEKAVKVGRGTLSKWFNKNDN